MNPCMEPQTLQRFWSKVDTTAAEGCWPWLAGTYPNGYGKFKMATGRNGGRAVLAHRFAYSVAFLAGAHPNGVVNHLCEHKPCANPNHLELTTQGGNVRYSLSSTCVRGHDLNGPDVYVEKNGRKRHCNACRRVRRGVKCGDIGEPTRHIEFEPMPTTVPIHEPSPDFVPAEPEKVPA